MCARARAALERAFSATLSGPLPEPRTLDAVGGGVSDGEDGNLAPVLDLVEEFRVLVGALETARVGFAVCGGLAAAIHARPRATLDVGLLVPEDQLDAAKRAARTLGYRIEAGPLVFKEGAVVIYLLSKPDPETGALLSLDLLVVTAALASVWATRERVEWVHGGVPVVSRSGLVAMKRLRGSGQDADDIRTTDMSPAAVTTRLLLTEQLRRLCVALSRARRTESRMHAGSRGAPAGPRSSKIAR